MLVLTLLFSTILHAQTISIQAPCSLDVLVSGMAREGQTLGFETIELLNHAQMSYQGSEQGINQINKSPIGRAAMDFVSQDELHSYGWCYSINGVIPEIYPHEIILNPSDQVVWFYGFARYYKGQWISQCEDSVMRKDSLFCQKLTESLVP